METKFCSMCGRTLPISDFYFRDGKPMAGCKECRVKQMRRYRLLENGKTCRMCGRTLPRREFYASLHDGQRRYSDICKVCERKMHESNMETEFCRKCGRTLPISDFYFRDGKPIAGCKECRAKQKRRKRLLENGKTCRMCGQRLPRSEFYSSLHDGHRRYSYFCKVCERKMRKSRYRRDHPSQDGVFRDPKTQHCFVRKNGHVSYLWTNAMVERLRRIYPTSHNRDLAEEFCLSMSTLQRKARQLGLAKNRTWMMKQKKEYLIMATCRHRLNCKKRNDNKIK